jgi:hypothetical protein
MLPKKSSKERKKQYLIDKYVKRDKMDVNDLKKFGVFWRPMGHDIEKWKLIAVCGTHEEAKEEIRWRAEFHKTNDGDLVLDNDKRFETFRDETKNIDKSGKTIEPEDIKADEHGNVIDMGHMLDTDAAPAGTSFNDALASTKVTEDGFRSMAYYQNIELEYRGYYKIDEIYDVTQ